MVDKQTDRLIRYSVTHTVCCISCYYFTASLSGYNFTPSSISSTDESTLTYHRITESFKFAYAKRSALGDEEFVDIDDVRTKFNVWIFESIFISVLVNSIVLARLYM